MQRLRSENSILQQRVNDLDKLINDIGAGKWECGIQISNRKLNNNLIMENIDLKSRIHKLEEDLNAKDLEIADLRNQLQSKTVVVIAYSNKPV